MKKTILILMISVFVMGLFAVGGDTFGTAVQITTLPYNDTGDTTTLTNTVANPSNDAFYLVNSVLPLTNFYIDLSTSSFDTYLWVYAADQTTVLWSNDDYNGVYSALFNLSLAANTDYYIVVEGYSSNNGAYGMDVGSDDYSGSIVNVGGPGVIANAVPVSGAVEVALLPTITWDFGTNTETYDLYFDTVNPPVTQVVADAVAGVSGSYTPPADLVEYTVYYWKVVSKNTATRLETNNPVYNFRTVDLAPGNISNAMPVNGAVNQALDVQLSWDFALNTETYDLYFDTVNPPVTQVVTDGIAGVGAYDPGTLLENTAYYWQVVSKNSASLRTTTDSYSFNTLLGADVIEIGIGTSTNLALPIEPYYGYSYSQSIYLQSDIDRTGQRIEKISYHYNQAGTLTNSTQWVIYMGHTTNTTFASTTSWLPISQFTEVYNGPLPTIQGDGWIEFVLTTPFVYNNTDNLVVAVEENQPGYGSSAEEFYCTTAPAGTSIRHYSDSVNANPATPPVGTLVSAYPNARLEFGDVPAVPEFSINPESKDFGTVFTGLSSAPQTFTIQNNGGADLIISDPIALADGTHFTLTDLNSYPLTIPSTMSASFDVTYNASIEGLVTDNIVIIDNVTRQTHNIPVQGTGFEATVSVFPYTQSFDTSAVPIGWSIDPATGAWTFATNEFGGHGATAEHTGNGGYYIGIDDSSPETVPAHLYTPPFNFGAVTAPVLSFWYWIGDAANTSELHIDVITGTGTDASVAVFTNPTGAATNGWMQADVSLTAYAGQTVSFDFRGMESTSFYGDICLDDIYIFDNTLPPAVTTLVTPADGAIDQLTGGTLQWNSVPYADGYDLYFGSDNPPTDILNGADQGTALSYSYSGLTGGMTYYWQVVPYNVNGDAVGASVWSFTTAATPPNPVTLIAPADGATGTFFDVTLSWNTDALADGYYLNFGTDNPPTNIENMLDNGSVTTYAATGLAGNTTYYWEVVPYNSNGNATGYATWSFTTYANTPSAIAMTLPADLATGVSEYPTFTWGADVWAFGYNLYISDDGTNYTMTDVGAVTGVTLTTPLNYETMYYWYVTGYNPNGEGPDPAAVRSFTVQSNQNFGGDGTLYGGYYFANSTPGGNGLGYQPTFAWNDISATGMTPTYTSPDDGYATVDIGFTFNYFGVDYTQVSLGTNGWIQFSGPTG
ncbi:MAG: choice-of-anchor D domain-containing protein, partial [Candidatus Cloacimonetes bacterium]|nr:choice-of-anchor D domain-containing protein [Candidatus Cloacimonadota bacterium]